MLTAGQAAAMIAAVSFAVLAGAGVYTLLKLARLISATSRAVSELRDRGDALIGRAQAAVDRADAVVGVAHEQLARTDAVTANMDQVSAAVAELTSDVSAATSALRVLVGGPLGRLAGLAYGIRHAIALRRRGRPAGRTAAPVPPCPQPVALVPAQRVAPGGRAPVPPRRGTGIAGLARGRGKAER